MAAPAAHARWMLFTSAAPVKVLMSGATGVVELGTTEATVGLAGVTAGGGAEATGATVLEDQSPQTEETGMGTTGELTGATGDDTGATGEDDGPAHEPHETEEVPVAMTDVTGVMGMTGDEIGALHEPQDIAADVVVMGMTGMELVVTGTTGDDTGALHEPHDMAAEVVEAGMTGVLAGVVGMTSDVEDGPAHDLQDSAGIEVAMTGVDPAEVAITGVLISGMAGVDLPGHEPVLSVLGVDSAAAPDDHSPHPEPEPEPEPDSIGQPEPLPLLPHGPQPELPESLPPPMPPEPP